jgi:hypothetical protein
MLTSFDFVIASTFDERRKSGAGVGTCIVNQALVEKVCAAILNTLRLAE